MKKDNSTKIQLHQEQLDIMKKWIQTGEVTVHKEVYTEEKSIIVPVTKEEYVIEKKVLNSDNSNKNEKPVEIIRIPVKEEKVEVIKHPVALGEVSVYLQQFQEIAHIDETLKKENLKINSTGNADIIDEPTQNFL